MTLLAIHNFIFFVIFIYCVYRFIRNRRAEKVNAAEKKERERSRRFAVKLFEAELRHKYDNYDLNKYKSGWVDPKLILAEVDAEMALDASN